MWFTIFHNRNTLYRACVKIDRAFHALTCFSPLHGDFHAPACLKLCDFSLYPHGSESILPGFGAVMMLGGRQSGETIFSALPEPILNVDMLIVTFKFLPYQTAHENTLHLSTGVFKVLGMIF